MRHAAQTAALASLLMCHAASALAQSPAPGLWEMRNRMGGNAEVDKAMARMQQQLATMTPAQRQQMEAMMGQNGMAMGPGGSMVVKTCITPDMAARAELPSQTEGDCTMTVTSRSANVIKASFVCRNPPGSGEGVFTFNGDKAYTSQMRMQFTRDGKVERMTLDGEARWLGASCGGVRPPPVPAK